MSESFTRYIVGGAVRDRLLGLPVQDRDWVVVGATPDALLAAGYKPVGKDFPVFLHPTTREEHALARTERKSGHGYSGFVFHTDPGVSLEDDLIRRDLTINAIAEAADGRLIDPYGGQRDLAARVFRHVSPAFAEDPVRILRIARFAARLPEFSIAPETLALMRDMVSAGEVDHLVPERVWQELARGLMCPRPSRMLQVLRECGALARLMPEVDALYGVPQPPQYHPEVDTGIHIELVVDVSAQRNEPLPVRTAALLHDLGKARTPPSNWPHHYGHEALGVPAVEALCARLKLPVDCRDMAVLTAREHGTVHQAMQMRPDTIARLLERVDVLRRPQRFDQLLAACCCDFYGRPGFAEREYPQLARLQRARDAYCSIDAGAIAREESDKAKIPERVKLARQQAVEAALG